MTSLLVTSASLVALITSLHTVGALRVVQLIWNLLFGLLIAIPHFTAFECLIVRVGFLRSWLGRGAFLLYVGTACLPADGARDGSKAISYFAVASAFLCGMLELISGCYGGQESLESLDRGGAAEPLVGGATKGKS